MLQMPPPLWSLTWHPLLQTRLLLCSPNLFRCLSLTCVHIISLLRLWILPGKSLWLLEFYNIWYVSYHLRKIQNQVHRTYLQKSFNTACFSTVLLKYKLSSCLPWSLTLQHSLTDLLIFIPNFPHFISTSYPKLSSLNMNLIKLSFS